jgi:hypothetical protein
MARAEAAPVEAGVAEEAAVLGGEERVDQLGGDDVDAGVGAVLAGQLGEDAAVARVDAGDAGREVVVLLDGGEVGQLGRVAAVDAVPDVGGGEQQATPANM